jgi:hypothetical protein
MSRLGLPWLLAILFAVIVLWRVYGAGREP